MIFSHLTQFYGPSLKTAWILRKPSMHTQTAPAPTPTFILIASSGAPEQTQLGLPSVNDQIKLFKQKFPKGVVIETSQYQGQMLWFQTFEQKLAKLFKQATADVYLFYTGHSHKHGIWAIDLKYSNLRDRQRNTVGWLIHLWKNHRSSENTYLYMFLDCCHGGSWCDKLKQHWKQEFAFNVGIFAGSSRYTNFDNGFFLKCVLPKKLGNLTIINQNLTKERACYYLPKIMQNPQQLRIRNIIKMREAWKNPLADFHQIDWQIKQRREAKSSRGVDP